MSFMGIPFLASVGSTSCQNFESRLQHDDLAVVEKLLSVDFVGGNQQGRLDVARRPLGFLAELVANNEDPARVTGDLADLLDKGLGLPVGDREGVHRENITRLDAGRERLGEGEATCRPVHLLGIVAGLRTEGNSTSAVVRGIVAALTGSTGTLLTKGLLPRAGHF